MLIHRNVGRACIMPRPGCPSSFADQRDVPGTVSWQGLSATGRVWSDRAYPRALLGQRGIFNLSLSSVILRVLARLQRGETFDENVHNIQ